MRKKWGETVTYQSDDYRDDKSDDQNEIYAYNSGNGDLYFGVRKVGTQLGMNVRICRDGGCSSKNPELMKSLTQAYDAMAGNTPTRTNCVWTNDVEVTPETYLTGCHKTYTFYPHDGETFGFYFCPYCGKDIA